MTEAKNRLQCVLSRINHATSQSNRPANTVQLLAVSKTWPADAQRLLAKQGQQHFGENYVQEAVDKIAALTDLSLVWHFIGPIQSNKTRDIAHHFDWVHSVDRLKIASRLSEQRPADFPPLNICLQVNIDQEDTKAGITAEHLFELAAAVSPLENIVLRGLMVIPKATDDKTLQHAAFQRAHKLFIQLQQRYPTVDTLSMGMSADLEAAIAEGSTLVRIGTALFGDRAPKMPQ